MPKKKSYITVTDQFCGAGGSSQGIKELAEEMNGGLEVSLALNHWDLAIKTHNTNFPETAHDCTDVSACDPRRYLSTDGLITSPECTNHSLAKGKKRKWKNQIKLNGKVDIDPSAERSRATMWDVPRFAEFHDYNFIIVENVTDVRHWVCWEGWLKAMHNLGYKHKCVYLNAMFAHPTPQSRDRIYIVFWKKGNPDPDLDIRPEAYCHRCDGLVKAVQSWKNPEKKWGAYKRQYIYCCPDCAKEVTPFYYSAINCIDWTIEADKIGERDRPLAENTIKRVEYGLERYGNRPLIIRKGESIKGVSKSPYFVELGHSSNNGNMNTPPHKGLPTQTTAQTMGLTIPPAFTVQMNRTGNARSLEEELPTVLSGGLHHAVVRAPFITEHYGNSDARSITERLGCLTTKETFGLVSPPFIAQLNGQSTARPFTEQLGCVTAGGANQALISNKSVSAFLSYYYGQAQASGMNEPAGTLSTRDRMALITQDLEKPELEECTFRMLKSHELKRAQNFPDDYVILGNSRERVKQIGNANPPKTIKLLVERCVETLKP